MPKSNREDLLNNVEELENQKKEYKISIQKLIENKLFKEAQYMINEYERIIQGDFDLYSLKALLCMSMEDFDKAIQIIEEGLTIDYRNFDLIYNLGYLYQIKSKFIDAYNTFKKAKLYCKNDIYKMEIEKRLFELENNKEVYLYNKERNEKKNNLPKVTVVISTYNQKENLEEAIDSFLCQDYPNLEIIVGDDCSTDGTEEFMAKYREYKEVVYVRHKVNLGAGVNSQKILDEYVDTKYCMLFNHDDYLIKDDYISQAVELLSKNPNLSFVWANCKVKNEIEGKWDVTNFNLPNVINGKDYFINYETNDYPHITGVVTTIFDFEKLKVTTFGYEKTKSRDTFLYLKLMLVGDVGFINDYVSVYRIHKSSISFNMPIEYDKSTIDEFEKLKKYAIDKINIDINTSETWINNRVYVYVFWRFITLWRDNKNTLEALDLLFDIRQKYPVVYNRIAKNIQSV